MHVVVTPTVHSVKPNSHTQQNHVMRRGIRITRETTIEIVNCIVKNNMLKNIIKYGKHAIIG